jgi:hypothetical protein
MKAKSSQLGRGGLSPPHVVERALRAVKDQFERDLSAEWNAYLDAPEIRNAMVTLPNRCRYCKKPIAGIAGDICSCRGRIEQERCMSNPRNALLSLFGRRCKSIVSSASLTEFVKTVAGIGLVYGGDLNWIGDQIQGLLPSFRRTFRSWINGVMPPPFIQTRVLPAWFRSREEVIYELDLQRGLDSEETENELVALEAEIDPYFEEAKTAALNQASIEMARVLPSGRKGRESRRARQDLRAAMIAKIKRNHPDWCIEQICKALDAAKCPMRETDRRAGFLSWHDVWKDPKNRNRIKRYISQILAAAPEREI